ncbi:MAG TPA: plastocyanin/azurin family copper-binding protein [Acidimicrobiales bacterium]|nr:plastocyanin/azurin family copper-binding protein [Acidimicrobiales bacterium]MDP7208336.1 plastocyanin/azurin family copper-binding protein [Acidimicrobiales bacterium]HJL88853.1 plastocyanin/azurin family copper-binding protein [Acidimicrobiales bacterium]HJO99764.1 plastocyanin/azurin family copper-binding protein [Acidimicrobiales bacterium]
MKHATIKKLTAVALAAAITLPLAACGGGSDGATSDSAAPSSSSTISVEGTEFKFAPADVSVKAGQAVTVTFDNLGAVDHEWAVLREGTQIKAETDFKESMVLLEVEAIPAGTSATQTFTFDKAGRYQIICALPGHFAAGMKGTLTVS